MNQQLMKSMQMLSSNAKHEKDEPFEDYSLFVYRMTAPDFKDRVKQLETKLLYPVRELACVCVVERVFLPTISP